MRTLIAPTFSRVDTAPLMRRLFTILCAIALFGAVTVDRLTLTPPAWGIGDDPPLQIVEGSPRIAYPLSVSIDDPTVVDVGSPSPQSPQAAAFVIRRIAPGITTTVRFTDATGGSASLKIDGVIPCGRPPLAYGNLIFPLNGATGVDPGIGKLYFALRYGGPTSSNEERSIASQTTLRLVLQHSGFDTGHLAVEAPPSGAGTPDPDAYYRTVAYMSGTIPRLRQGTTYRVQLYNDTCEGPNVAGEFTTSR